MIQSFLIPLFPMVTAIVPAAGRSTRMGALKQLLPFGEHTVVERVISTLIASKVNRVVVVLGHRAEEIRRVLSTYPVTITVNPDPDGDMLSSVQCGVRTAEPGHAFLIALGDQPLITAGTVDRLIEAAARTEAGIVVPSYQGRRGHPVLIAARHREDILALRGDGGLKQLREQYPDAVYTMPVETDEILIDLDQYQEYKDALKRLPEE